MNYKKIVHTTAAGIFLLLFTAYYANVTLFCHTHIINGVTLVHSHFHNRQHHDTDDGGHTVVELTLIAHLTNQMLTTGESPETDLPVYDSFLQTLGIEQASPVVSIHLSCPSLRAPPV